MDGRGCRPPTFWAHTGRVGTASRQVGSEEEEEEEEEEESVWMRLSVVEVVDRMEVEKE